MKIYKKIYTMQIIYSINLVTMDIEKIKDPKMKKMYQSEHIKLWWTLFFIWNLLAWLWIIAIIIYYIVKKEELNDYERKAFYEMFNFSISLLLYFIISSILVLVIIWIFLILILVMFAFIVSIIGFIKHLTWKNYEYPLTISFFKVE